MISKSHFQKKIIALLIILFCISVNSNNSFSENSPKSKHSNAKQQEKSQADSDDNMHYNLGVIAAETKNFQEALREFSIAIAINPKNTYALYGKGSVYYQLKEMDSAIVYLDEILKLQSDNELALSLRSAIYQQIEKYDKAIIDYNKLIKKDSANSHYFLNLAYCYQMANDTTKAIDNYLIAERKGNKSAELYYNLSNLYASKGNYAKSLEYVNKMIEKDMQNPDIFDLQVYNIMKVYGCDSSLHRYSVVSKNLDNPAQILLQIGVCKFEAKDYLTAIDLFTESFKMDSSEILNLYYRGFANARVNKTELCVQDLQDFIKLSQSQNDFIEFQESAQKQIELITNQTNQTK